MKHLRNPALALALASLASAHAAEVPIDLNSWQKVGPVSNGNWVVAPDGQSVNQTINDDPTFFVGPDTLINTLLRGRIIVNTTGDDDFIGFVMGYQGPAGTGNDMDFVLLDWKQNSQSNGGYLGQEGFALSRVKGTITNYLPGFWGHTEDATWDVLGTNHSSTNGWADRTEYRFAITYLADRVTVAVTGGAFGTETNVLDVAGSFPAGRFGFYNFSQANVTYSGFTIENLPPPVPEPGTWALLAAGLAVVARVARRRA